MITFKVADRLIREAFYPSNKNHDLFEVDFDTYDTRIPCKRTCSLRALHFC